MLQRWKGSIGVDRLYLLDAELNNILNPWPSEYALADTSGDFKGIIFASWKEIFGVVREIQMIAQQRDFLDTMYENRFEPVEESNTL